MKWFEVPPIRKVSNRPNYEVKRDGICFLNKLQVQLHGRLGGPGGYGGLTDAEYKDYRATISCLQAVEWEAAKRPYFNVYPLFAEKLRSLDTSGATFQLVKDTLDKIRLKNLFIRLPKASPEGLVGILVSVNSLPDHADGDLLIIPCANDTGYPWCSAIHVSWQDNMKEWLSNVALHHRWSSDHVTMGETIFKILLGIFLLDSSDRDFFEPVILSRDADRLDRIGEDRAVERAKKRGTVGWHVGRKFEDISRSGHFRNGCLCVYWTGQGGAVPVVKFRKGGFVKPTRKHSVPTGYLGNPELTESKN